MKMYSVYDEAFLPYGAVLEDFDGTDLLRELSRMEIPAAGIRYEPSEPALESLPAAARIQHHIYGEMPIQVGVCRGSNYRLNCLEYHRGSEINLPDAPIVLLLAHKNAIRGGTCDTGVVQAFRVPAKTAVLLYETTLHFAPCGENFRVVVVLPQGTNTPLGHPIPPTNEGAMLLEKNKWLLAHPQSEEARKGAYVGLTGENITLEGSDILCAR